MSPSTLAKLPLALLLSAGAALATPVDPPKPHYLLIDGFLFSLDAPAVEVGLETRSTSTEVNAPDVRLIVAVGGSIGLMEWWAQSGPSITPVVATPEPNYLAVLAVVLMAMVVFYGRRAGGVK